MSVRDYNQTMTEAVAVFHDAEAMQAAVDDLLTHGFDHAELSVLANNHPVSRQLAERKVTVADFEDDPSAPRAPYVANESFGDAEGGMIAACVYVPVIAAAAAVASTGGSLFTIITAALIAGAFGLVIGLALAGILWRHHSKKIDELLEHGGLLLWVRTHDAAHEKRALRILQKHAADDVHLHKVPAPARALAGIPTRRPALSFGSAA